MSSPNAKGKAAPDRQRRSHRFPYSRIQSTAALGIVRHVFAKLSGTFHAMKGRLVLGHGNAIRVSVPTTGHKSAPPIEPVSAPPIEPVSVIPVEIVPAPEPPPPSISYAEAALVPTASSSPVSSETEKGLDECEALLRHAIEMVRGPTQSPQTAPVAETTAATPAELDSSAPVERSRPEVVVQIHHDSQKAKYVAKDTKSGLSVLGHQDSARLRAMCDRMGWQVVDGE